MADVFLYSQTICSYCDRAKELLRSKGVEYREVNCDEVEGAREEMIERSGQRTVPQIWIDDVHVGGSDDLFALEQAGKLDAMLGKEKQKMPDTEHAKIVIIGSGPAGYTAGIYAARAELEPVMFAGMAFGGQLMLTTDVENYPGFPEGVTGPEMMELFQKQAERFGTRVFNEDVTEVDFSERPFKVKSPSRAYTADSVIIATGASARWLGLDSEERLMNRGVSACATCDGALFRGKAMAVVGGGDTAMEEALFLTRFASTVHVVHRREELRASKIMGDRAKKNVKIDFLLDSVVDEILGGEEVEGVAVKNIKNGETKRIDVGAVFVAIGHKPNTDLFQGIIDTNEAGYIVCKSGSTRTNIEGVFACGDVMDPTYRQAVTAAGTGCMAALDSERWLAEQE